MKFIIIIHLMFEKNSHPQKVQSSTSNTDTMLSFQLPLVILYDYKIALSQLLVNDSMAHEFNNVQDMKITCHHTIFGVINPFNQK